MSMKTFFQYWFRGIVAITLFLILAFVFVKLGATKLLLRMPTDSLTSRNMSASLSRVAERRRALLLMEKTKSKVCDTNQEPDLMAMFESKYKVPMRVQEEKFTVLILTYDRLDALYMNLKTYAKMAKVGQIIVLWNNEKEPPEIDKNVNFTVPFLIKRGPNKLSRRFLPLDKIMYQGILNLDDDIALSETAVNNGFNVWKAHAYGLVGYAGSMRSHSLGKNGTYKYESRLPLSKHSLTLTGCVFMHREYLRMFTERAPPAMIQEIDSFMNCEDIAMNMVVADYCKCSPVFQVQKKSGNFKGVGAGKGKGLHFRKDHYNRRATCIKSFAEYFTSFPLRYVKASCAY